MENKRGLFKTLPMPNARNRKNYVLLRFEFYSRSSERQPVGSVFIVRIALCPSRKDSNLSSMPSRVPSSSFFFDTHRPSPFPLSSFYPSDYFLSRKIIHGGEGETYTIYLYRFPSGILRDKTSAPRISPTISVCRVNGTSNGCTRFCKVSAEETLNIREHSNALFACTFAQTFEPSLPRIPVN